MADPLTDFIESHAPHLHGSVTEDTPLLEERLLDSLLLMSLIAFLERRYAIAIPDEEIVPEHFSTLRNIRALIAKHTSARPG
jgi:acyl carrier protein